MAAESPLPSLGLKLAGVGRLLDAGIRLASPPPREPLREQSERRDEREDLRHDVHGNGDGGGRVAESGRRSEREHEQYQGQAEEGGPGQFHHGRHQPYESGSETPNAIKIAMRAKQAPVSRSVLILGMKSMK